MGPPLNTPRRPRPEQDRSTIFRLWGSRRWRRTNAPPKKPRWRTWVARDFTPPTLFSQRRAPRRCGRKLPRNAASPPSMSLLAASRPPSWEREKGAAGVMGGQGRAPPGRGSKGPEPLASPQCITLGSLAPRHLAVRRRRRASPPRTARRSAVREGCRWRDGWPRPNLRPRPRSPRSSGPLSGPTIPVSPQAAGPAVPEREIGPANGFRGALACQRPGNGSLPGKARGFRGQDTVELPVDLDAVLDKIDQVEEATAASAGAGWVDHFRLRGSRRWRRNDCHPFRRGGGDIEG